MTETMCRERRPTTIVIVIFLLCLLGIYLGALAELESKTWDWRLRSVATRSHHDPNIKLVMIDQTSLEHFAHREKIYWPWPRSLYNPVLFFLQKAGARAVGFDMLFAELSCHYEDDLSFAEAVSSTVPVVSSVAARSSGIDYGTEPFDSFRVKQRDVTTNLTEYLTGLDTPHYQYATFPLPELLQSTAAVANVTARADTDKIFRRASAGAVIRETPLLSLPFAVAHILDGDGSIMKAVKPLADSSGRFLVRFFGPEGTYQSYSIHALITSWVQIERGEKPTVPLEDFKDAIVIIGSNAASLLDIRPTPFGVNYSGAEFNATILDNVLHHSFLREVPAAIAYPVLFLLLWLVGKGWMRLTRFQVPFFLFIVAGWSMLCFILAWCGWWMPLVIPILGMVAVALGIIIVKYQTEGRQHRFIRNVFKYYVSPEVIQTIVGDPSTLVLGGERRELTIFFSDIAGFTAMSERMKPDQLVRLLNRILSEVSDIILSEGGTIDKYQGDAVIAFWNAPLQQPRHPDLAVRAALRCQTKLRGLAQALQNEFGVEISMRIGLHTGDVAVGNFGSKARFNYTIVGDAANLTSRLEGFNKVFGSAIMVSRATKERVGSEYSWRRLGLVRVAGRAEAVEVFEPLDPTFHRDLIERLADFHRAQALYEGEQFGEAAEIFRRFPNDPASVSYLAKCEEYLAHPERFSVVWSSKEK